MRTLMMLWCWCLAVLVISEVVCDTSPRSVPRSKSVPSKQKDSKSTGESQRKEKKKQSIDLVDVGRTVFENLREAFSAQPKQTESGVDLAYETKKGYKTVAKSSGSLSGDKPVSRDGQVDAQTSHTAGGETELPEGDEEKPGWFNLGYWERRFRREDLDVHKNDDDGGADDETNDVVDDEEDDEAKKEKHMHDAGIPSYLIRKPGEDEEDLDVPDHRLVTPEEEPIDPDADDLLDLDWGMDETQDDFRVFYLLSNSVHAVFAKTRTIADLLAYYYLHHALAAVVVVVWLVNILLFVGLWRVPKPPTNMRIQSSHSSTQNKPKKADAARRCLSSHEAAAPRCKSSHEAATSTCQSSNETEQLAARPYRPQKRSRSTQDPEKADSTIATITVFIGGEGGKDVDVVQARTEAAAAAAAGGGGECKGLEPAPATQAKQGRHHRRALVAIDSSAGSPKIRVNKRVCKSKERKRLRNFPSVGSSSTVTVFDLKDPSNLPHEIIDLLACQGDGLCVHDHDRCRVVNNKLYISNRPGRSPTVPRKLKISELSDSPVRHHQRVKRVTFSPMPRPRSVSPVNDFSWSVSGSTGTESNLTEDTKSMPPPPQGYHVRIDPSSLDTSSNISEGDNVSLSCTDLDSEPTTECSESLRAIIKAALARSGRRRLSIHSSKDDLKKRMIISPRRLAKSLRSHLKKLGFDSEYILSEKKLSKKLKDLNKTPTEIHKSEDVSAWNDSPDMARAKGNLSQVIGDSKRGVARAKLGLGRDSSPERSFVKEVSESPAHTAVGHNVGRLRHTRRRRTNVNNNSRTTNSLCQWRRRKTSQWYMSTLKPGRTVMLSKMSTTLPLAYLNTNINANSGGETLTTTDDEKQEPGSSLPCEDYILTTTSHVEPVTDAKVGSTLPSMPTMELNQVDSKAPNSECPNTGDLVPQRNDPKENLAVTENEAEGWETKRQNIMMACQEAIRHRLQRQNVEDTDSRDVTTSESGSARHSSGPRKRRKTKTSESVYVKFKTSLSKKMTTTTTLKQMRQQQAPQAISAPKTLMLEHDVQSALGVSSQSSDQSLSIPQPRHTRIVKCGDMELPRRRKLSSDTEVELLHLSCNGSPQYGGPKAEKDAVRDKQIVKKENFVPMDTSATEDTSMEFDKQITINATQHSPRQNSSLGGEEIIGECDRVSEKASAITVIDTGEKPKMIMKKDKRTSSQTPDVEEAILSPRDRPGSVGSSVAHDPNGPEPIQLLKYKERAKRRNKPYAHTHSKKKGAVKKTIKTIEICDTSDKVELLDQLQSDTSLQFEKKETSAESSLAKSVRPCLRSHSSPPEFRKKKNGLKKKITVFLTEPPEVTSKRSLKGRKKSPDKKKKSRISVLRSGRPRKTGSTSSTGSERKKKSHTTASSISMDSFDCRQQEEENTVCEEEVIEMDQSALKPMSETKPTKSSNPQTLESQREESQKSINPKTTVPKVEAETVRKKENVKEKPAPPPPQTGMSNNTEGQSTKEGAPSSQKRLFKTSHIKIANRNQPQEKDLRKAEMGWNNSVFSVNVPKSKVPAARAKVDPRRPKLKYFIVKANKRQEENSVKPTVKVPPQADTEEKQSLEIVSDAKSEVPGDLSSRGKTVQFSESIDKIENLNRTELVEEADVESAHDTHHVDTKTSDGSIGDAFLSDNFELVKEMVILDAEVKSIEPPSEIQPQPAEVSLPKKRHKKPVWLKRSANKPAEETEASAVPTTPTTAHKLSLSPRRLEKRHDSLEEILKSKKCNIQVTYPLAPTGASQKGDQTAVKTRVAYSTLLSNIFMALPLKKTAKRMIAHIGSPVDIKEVTEGSSVDAADYSKGLRYSPKVTKRPGVTSAPSVQAAPKKKKGVAEIRALGKAAKVGLGDSCSSRSLLSAESDVERRVLTPNCSFSTDLDEASVCRPRSAFGHNAAQSRAHWMSSPRKKEKQASPRTLKAAAGGRVAAALPWHNSAGGGVSAISDHDLDPLLLPEECRNDLPELPHRHVAGDMRDTNAVNVGLPWILQELFNRFNFLSPRRHYGSLYRPSANQPYVVEHPFIAG